MMHSSLINHASSRMLLLSLASLLLFGVSLFSGAVDAQSTDAIGVIGQPSFTSTRARPFGPHHPNNLLLGSSGYGIAADRSGGLYVADGQRITFFPPGANATTGAAIRVYGQRNFNIPMGVTNPPTATSLYDANDVAIASDGVYISDSRNNRVLFYPGTSTTPSRVYGTGGSFVIRGSGGLTAETFHPTSIAVDHDDNLYVAEFTNDRVLFFPKGSTIATRVYGQAGNFTTDGSPSTPNADSLASPRDVVASIDGVYIADHHNRRVLFYPGNSTTASIVYGQKDFVSYEGGLKGPNNVGVPYSIEVDSHCNLYVGGLSRVLFFPRGSTTATRVYGQGGDFTTTEANKGGVGPSSLNGPTRITVGGDSLFIRDSYYRVLKYPLNDGSGSNDGPCASRSHTGN